jgi:hypothetical protein
VYYGSPHFPQVDAARQSSWVATDALGRAVIGALALLRFKPAQSAKPEGRNGMNGFAVCALGLVLHF